MKRVARGGKYMCDYILGWTEYNVQIEESARLR
jgi:hypothetical protein